MITIVGWHITAYQLGKREGSCTVYLALALVGVWLATMWWRDPKPSDSGGEGEAALLARRRTRIVKYGILATSVTWLLLMAATDVYAIQAS